MREQEESRDLLYAIRALEIMMSSGVGLEAAILSIAGGGYGIISEDFQKMIIFVYLGNLFGFLFLVIYF